MVDRDDGDLTWDGASVSAPGGRGLVAPRSVRHLTDAQRAPVTDLVRVAEQWEHLHRHAVEAVTEARSRGVSWAVIGWALGLTGEGARLRYAGDVGLL